MYPKQLYQAQNLYNRNKDNFRDIKIAIYDQLAVDSDLEDIEMCLLRVNNRIAKIDVDLNPQSGFKGNSEMLRTEKAPLIEIREILAAATPPAASSSLLPGGGGGSNRKRKSRKDSKDRKGRKGRKDRNGRNRQTRRKNRNE